MRYLFVEPVACHDSLRSDAIHVHELRLLGLALSVSWIYRVAATKVIHASAMPL